MILAIGNARLLYYFRNGSKNCCFVTKLVYSFCYAITHIQGAAQRVIKQFHYLRWPDFGSPDNPEQLIEFVSDVRIHVPHEQSGRGPIIVHCR